MMITWDNAAEKAAGMAALAAAVGTKHTYDWADDVAQVGEDSIRETIQDGGVVPTKKGGPRIKSGSMFASVSSRAYAGGGNGHATAGFLDGPPPHTIWQEGGTSRGIPPMVAVPMAAIKMEIAADTLGLVMLADIAGEWNAI